MNNISTNAEPTTLSTLSTSRTCRTRRTSRTCRTLRTCRTSRPFRPFELLEQLNEIIRCLLGVPHQRQLLHDVLLDRQILFSLRDLDELSAGVADEQPLNDSAFQFGQRLARVHPRQLVVRSHRAQLLDRLAAKRHAAVGVAGGRGETRAVSA